MSWKEVRAACGISDKLGLDPNCSVEIGNTSIRGIWGVVPTCNEADDTLFAPIQKTCFGGRLPIEPLFLLLLVDPESEES